MGVGPGKRIYRHVSPRVKETRGRSLAFALPVRSDAISIEK